VVSIHASYSAGAVLKSIRRPATERLFVVFLGPSKQMPAEYIKSGHDPIHSKTFPINFSLKISLMAILSELLTAPLNELKINNNK
jgi:hypothetical protein